MSEEVLEQIFDPFFTTKEATHGLGLGLSISAKIVKDFGGKLIASSKANNGTNIQLTLKLAT